MENNKKHTELLEANIDNVDAIMKKIQEYATLNNYRILGGELKLPTTMLGGKKALRFESKKKKKVLRAYINRLDKHMGLAQINCFLHFLFKKIYELDKAPYVELSEKEIKIQTARKAWKKAAAEAEKLRAEYRKEKGDFYKQNRIAA